jgi:N-acyl-D-amino-acid deacylase
LIILIAKKALFWYKYFMNKISRRQFIKNSIKGTALLVPAGPGLLLQGTSKQKEYDLVISQGIVYDGLGNPGKEVDIAVKGNKIFFLEKNLDKSKAKKVIEAKGLAVAPGFIDAHDHTDLGLLANPKAESQVRQGVTTIISGNCGSSPFPVSNLISEEWKTNAKKEYDIDFNWKDITGFFNRLKEKGMALNYGTLLGHGSLRAEVVGLDDIPPTENQLKQMQKLVEENIKAGALGLSTGLEYAPGSFAKSPEILALCQTVALNDGIYATHMRSEGDFLLESLEESIDIARKTNVSLQISHLKVAYPGNWSKIDAALSTIEAAHKQGINIHADRYPYIAGSTGLALYFPLWAKQGTAKDFVARLKDPKLDAKLRSHLQKQEKKLGSWDKILISSVITPKNKKVEGKTVLEAAGEAGKPPYEFMRDLLIDEEARVTMITFIASEDNLKRILAHPLVVIGADGEAIAPYGILGKGKPHPRLYGTFPRVLGKYARDEKIFSLAKGIQKMTSITAKKFGLRDRGQVKEGYFADLVVFNPDKIIDCATWKDPHQYPKGIDSVIVNGQIVIHEGEHTGNLPGKTL